MPEKRFPRVSCSARPTIRATARRFAAFEPRVYLIFQMDADNEPEEFGTPDEFRAAFRVA